MAVRLALFVLVVALVAWITTPSHGFAPPPHQEARRVVVRWQHESYVIRRRRNGNSSNCRRFLSSRPDRDEAEVEEEVRLKMLKSRREQIRWTLRNAESLRNFRLAKGWVPEIDEATGKPIKSDGKVALSLTAFVVAAGAIALRIGGRAALISTLGLDFMTDNPDIRNNLDKVLDASDNMDPLVKLLIFTAAWTCVKVFCFDAGGVILALAAGILFGGILQGAVLSAAAATFGSSVAFAMAKLDTPVRKKAMEALEEYPSLRGIERVVAQDGLKAILTLRLAPILPIPIGMYNYVYGVTKVPYLDFAGGIFLGSLKPYLLDSYLGYFGKDLIESGPTSAESMAGMQDVLLLVALGVSVLIGVFASQLAAETWDSVLEEVEAEKKAKEQKEGEEKQEEEKGGVIRELFGWELPEWIVGFQLSMQMAEKRMYEMTDIELEAKVWNYTKDAGDVPCISPVLDPACKPDSPEVQGANKGIDYAGGLCDSLALTPVLFTSFLKYADPLYNQDNDEDRRKRAEQRAAARPSAIDVKRKELNARLNNLRRETQERIEFLDSRLQKEQSWEQQEKLQSKDENLL